MGTCRDVSARVEAIESLLATEIAIEETKTDHHEGTIDKLTSLYNRHYFEEYAEQVVNDDATAAPCYIDDVGDP